MEKECRKIGIMGGTFNPVHHGHLIVAQTLLEDFCLDRILFIPTRFPPHKKDSEIISAHHRHQMLKEAISSNTGFEVSTIEMEREGTTYTVVTLEELRRSYDAETRLYFITGADVIHDLRTWKDYQRVFTLCEFIAVMRPGFEEAGFLEAIHGLQTQDHAIIHTARIPLLDISSTGIRERIQAGKSVKYLVPDRVERYLAENCLYL